MVKKYPLLFFLLLSLTLFSQNSSFYEKSDTLNIKRRNAIIISEGIVLSGALISLNELWYKNYPQRNFHLKNDYNQWKQMDKVGHFMTSYYGGKLGMDALNWAGVSKKNQLIYGAGIGFVFLSAVEILDGFSEEWGASTSDVIANAAGTGFLIGQELLWKEQRISVKYSFHQTNFAKQRPAILGENYFQQTLKDYNGQTYWLSFNMKSLLNIEQEEFPNWLNLAVGYSGDNMTNPYHEEGDDERKRQYLLSLDVDLTKINTKNKTLNSVLHTFGFLKFPAPAIQYTNGNIFFHPIYY